ncbi:hypothetical protein EIP91_005366, partial [Steccherinum ochraceum]
MSKRCEAVLVLNLSIHDLEIINFISASVVLQLQVLKIPSNDLVSSAREPTFYYRSLIAPYRGGFCKVIHGHKTLQMTTFGGVVAEKRSPERWEYVSTSRPQGHVDENTDLTAGGRRRAWITELHFRKPIADTPYSAVLNKYSPSAEPPADRCILIVPSRFFLRSPSGRSAEINATVIHATNALRQLVHHAPTFTGLEEEWCPKLPGTLFQCNNEDYAPATTGQFASGAGACAWPDGIAEQPARTIARRPRTASPSIHSARQPHRYLHSDFGPLSIQPRSPIHPRSSGPTLPTMRPVVTTRLPGPLTIG